MIIMTHHKRKKNSRQRGSMTHGWGSKKKHRGAGNRGGKGLAGTGKRSDTKKPMIWKDKHYFGKRGFTSHTGKESHTINTGYLSSHITKLHESKIASKKDDTYTIDLTAIGYTKLLGKGRVSVKLHIVVGSATPKAIEAVKKTGGTVTIPDKQ
ncbi:MAG: uL15m family ribosomal protein [Candidatus Woesearchaeota archaeon]